MSNIYDGVFRKNRYQLKFAIFAKRSILDVWQGSKYVFAGMNWPDKTPQ